MGCSNPAEARDPQLSPTAPRTPKGSCGRPRPGHERAECVLVGRAWAVAPGCHAAEGDPQPGVGTRAEAECKGKRLLECCTKSFQSENVTNHRRERRPHVWHAPQKPPPPRWAQATARARDRPPEQMSLAGRAGSAACLQQKPAQGPGAAPLTSGRGGAGSGQRGGRRGARAQAGRPLPCSLPRLTLSRTVPAPPRGPGAQKGKPTTRQAAPPSLGAKA